MRFAFESFGSTPSILIGHIDLDRHAVFLMICLARWLMNTAMFISFSYSVSVMLAMILVEGLR